MKSLFLALSLLMTLPAFSAEHGYWVEDSFCGEIHPFVLGDVCVVQVANHDETFVVLLDFEFVMNNVDGEIEHGTTLSIEKKGLRKVTKKDELAEIRAFSFTKNLRLFKAHKSFVTFEHLSDEE